MGQRITLLTISLLALFTFACSDKKKTGTLCSGGSDCDSGICAAQTCVQALCSLAESSLAACPSTQTCVKLVTGTEASCVDSSKLSFKDGSEDATGHDDDGSGSEDALSTREQWVQKFCEESIKVCLETAPALDTCKKSFDDPSARTPTQDDLNCLMQYTTVCETPMETCCSCWGPIFSSTP
ncbi:MAG: hypothetical protein KC609_20680 [Myxococcales bacterium]|nr:hypothetical protein [Myxococcales bacterium]